MSKTRLVVTGAKGFVGQHVLRTVAEKYPDQFEIVDFIDPADGSRPDIRNPDAVGRAVESTRPDSLIHLAAVAAPRQAAEDWQKAWQVNVQGTFHIAAAIRNLSPNTRMIWAGSSEAYGKTFNICQRPLTEAAPLRPVSPYGATKAAADTMLRELFKDQIDVVVFRAFNHTGPGQALDYVVPAFAAQIARIEAGLQSPTIMVGNLSAKRDFLHVSDVVEAYLQTARATTQLDSNTLNLSSGNPVSISEVLNYLLTQSSRKVAVEVDPGRYSPNLVPVASGDHSSITSLLGWVPKFSLEETLASVLAEHRALLRPNN